MPLHRSRRAGLSLVEVLVALFIMALGMIALLTLFPLGALQMGQALKDDRCSQAVNAADNYMRTYWKQYVLEQPNSPDPFTTAFWNPRNNPYYVAGPGYGQNSTVIPTIPGGQMPNLLSNNAVTAGILPQEPSYPVFIDPRGFEGRRKNPTFSQEVFWVAGRQPTPYRARIPRRTLAVSVASQNPSQPLSGLPAFGAYVDPVRTCTLLDDLTYDENASALRVDSNGMPLPVERQGRYTWGWMLQLPRVADPTTANMTVVVYDNRNPDYPAADGEQVYTAANNNNVNYVIGATTLTFTYPAGGTPPNIRAGSWILNGTMRAPIIRTRMANGTAGLNINNANIRVADFYRVTGVEIDESSNPVVVRLDLQTPIKPLTGAGVNLPAGVTATDYFGDLYVLKGVAEVFERKPLSPSNQPD
jgi:hypothetical protein